jgi:uncharacterized protein
LSKLLFFILLAVVAVAWFKSQQRVGHRQEPGRGGSRNVEDMVRCQVCGINLPRSEAILSRGRIYCSDEHRRQDQEG